MTLTDFILAAYLRYGRDGAIDPDGYMADMAVVGRSMGVVDPPTTQAGPRDCLHGFDSELA